ncbi:MAG TPA: HAD hydrolase-like protein [Burkholderiales bacterium]|nr:HAD hydrolase-like protein [Burkholderiales bacterium]
MNVLIDLDGTLTDPREGMFACFRHALAAVDCGIPSDKTLEACIGPPVHESLRRFLGTEKEDRFEEALVSYRERFSSKGLYENAVYPGVREALVQLRGRGVSLHLATSKPLVYATRIMAHFGLTRFFSSIHGSELDGTRSHKDELIRHIIETESLERSATRMVGDRAYDVIGAKANGVIPVGVLWGYGTREELLSAGAQFLCERPAMLIDVLSPGGVH